MEVSIPRDDYRITAFKAVWLAAAAPSFGRSRRALESNQTGGFRDRFSKPAASPDTHTLQKRASALHLRRESQGGRT